tara:strand:+ start:3527 stop:3736 length:210 start_codon:yes stop_codon:yes gene_type:complete
VGRRLVEWLRQSTFTMQRMGVKAIRLRVRKKVSSPRFEVRQRHKLFYVIDHNAGELQPVFGAKVYPFAI